MLGPLGMQAEIERIPINRIHTRFMARPSLGRPYLGARR